MLIGIPFDIWLCLITVFIVLLEIFVCYKTYSKILKYLALSLLAYVLTAFFVKPDWLFIGKSTVLPQVQLSSNYLLNVVAILGTTISPYLFFWQASEEVEDEICEGKIPDIGVKRPRITKKNIVNMHNGWQYMSMTSLMKMRLAFRKTLIWPNVLALRQCAYMAMQRGSGCH